VSGEGPELGDLLGMGVSIAGLVVSGFGIGWLVDLAFGTFPVCALVGLLLGVIAACFYMYGQFKKFMAETEDRSTVDEDNDTR
jgi:F0F1-type ATP synthase assembly protein I